MQTTPRQTNQNRSAAADWYADGRPQWDELCDCAMICHTVRPKGMNESLKDFAARSEQTLRHAYEGGADWTYDADCQHCDTGRKHTDKDHATDGARDENQPKKSK